MFIKNIKILNYIIMRRGCLFVLLINLHFFLFIGCTKEKLDPNEPKLYIRGDFGEESLEFLNQTENTSYYVDYLANPMSNKFFLLMHQKPTIFESRYIQISINRIGIDTLITPWESETNPIFPNPYVNLGLIDGKTNSQFDANDSINYSGSQLQGNLVYVKINAIVGDTIEGIFNGEISTMTGLKKQVTNGEFRVMFERITQ